MRAKVVSFHIELISAGFVRLNPPLCPRSLCASQISSIFQVESCRLQLKKGKKEQSDLLAWEHFKVQSAFNRHRGNRVIMAARIRIQLSGGPAIEPILTIRIPILVGHSRLVAISLFGICHATTECDCPRNERSVWALRSSGSASPGELSRRRCKSFSNFA